MTEHPQRTLKPPTVRTDEAEAMRFLAIKAAIFILVPLIAAALAVLFLMPKSG